LFLCTGKGREGEKALWRRAKHKSAVMWKALRREDHTSLDVLVTDKKEACTRLAQLPCTSKQDAEEMLIGMLELLRVKCRAHR
jgi:hypothetical protein